MKKYLFVVVFASVAIIGAVVIFIETHNRTPQIAARPIKLVLTGPAGQRFTGTYTADGNQSEVSAVLPATINVQAKELSYQFQPDDQRQEFRVVLQAQGITRTSFVSYRGDQVRGGYSYSADHDAVW